MLGHEAGLFTVTGSLANMLGVRTWVRPGQELLCEARAHVVRAELGGHAAWHGVTTRTWSHPRGHVDLDALRSMLAPTPGRISYRQPRLPSRTRTTSPAAPCSR